MASKRKQDMAKRRKVLKEARMKTKPKSESAYALKRRGIYPPNSPYRTIWKEFA